MQLVVKSDIFHYHSFHGNALKENTIQLVSLMLL